MAQQTKTVFQKIDIDLSSFLMENFFMGTRGYSIGDIIESLQKHDIFYPLYELEQTLMQLISVRDVIVHIFNSSDTGLPDEDFYQIKFSGRQCK